MQPDYNTYNYNTPAPQNASGKRFLITLGTTLAAVVLIIIFASSFWSTSSKAVVTLNPLKGTTTEIGTATDGENGQSIGKSYAKATAKTSVRLATGTYLVIFSGNTYVQQNQLIKVTGNTTIETPTLDLSPDRLNTLLKGDMTDIHNATQAQATSITLSSYTFKNEALYHDGTWYATTLVPTDLLNTIDPQVLIMHQVNGQWKLVAGPKIVLYVGDYPAVPSDIIRDINNRPVIDSNQ